MQNNPYQSPAATLGGSSGFGNSNEVNQNTVDMLARTRPWVLFLAIIGFIFCGLMVLGGISVIAMSGQMGIAGPSEVILFTGLAYLVMAGIYLLPTIKMLQYSSAISTLKYSPSVEALDNALDRQRSFWKTMGIFMIVMIGLWIAMVVVFAVLGATMANSLQNY